MTKATFLVALLVFIFLFVLVASPAERDKATVRSRGETEDKVSLLQPMFPVMLYTVREFGVAETKGEVLNCDVGGRARRAIVDGQEQPIMEIVLTCGEKRFVVKGVRFQNE